MHRLDKDARPAPFADAMGQPQLDPKEPGTVSSPEPLSSESAQNSQRLASQDRLKNSPTGARDVSLTPRIRRQPVCQDTPALKLVEFSVELPHAGTVQLAADFTDWEQSPIDMVRYGDGVWSTRIPLPAGTYTYRFIVDGKWYDDPRSVRPGSNSVAASKAFIQIK